MYGAGRELSRFHVKHLPEKGRVQIPPFRVRLLDQSDLPISPPLLDRLLTSDCIRGIIMGFEPHQTIDGILSSETRHTPSLVLMHAAQKVIRNPDVERPMPPAGKKVNMKRHQASPAFVIPGRPGGPGPEPMDTEFERVGSNSSAMDKSACIGSGLAAAPRPGMTPAFISRCRSRGRSCRVGLRRPPRR